jgi:N-acetylmuramoyl-L-alanine amidase
MRDSPAARLRLVVAALAPLLSAAIPAGAAETAAEPAAVAAPPPLMVAARVVGDARRIRFVADVTGQVDVVVFTLPDPYRIVVDLPEVRFSLPEGTGAEGRGLVSAFRYGLISPGKSRIVLDVTGPVAIDKSFVVPPAGDQPARIVIDVVPTSRQAFLQASKAFRETQTVAAGAKHDRELVVPEKAAGNRLTIVLDPGHGGIDDGAHGTTGVLEKDLTLAFAKVLGAKLEKTGLYDVFYTRTDDSFVALGDRVAFARTHRADLFVSMHANSFPTGSVRGTTVYTVSDEASDKMVADIAARENQSDVLAGLDIDQADSSGVKDILLDLTRRETRNFGVVFAKTLVKELKASTRMFKIPHQQAGFIVLEAPDVPSAMIELGFVTNEADEKLLLSDGWRDKQTDAIVGAIAGYFRTRVAGGG